MSKEIVKKIYITCEFCSKKFEDFKSKYDAVLNIKARKYNSDGFYLFLDHQYELCDSCYLKFVDKLQTIISFDMGNRS